MLGKCAGYAHCYRITELLGLEKTLKTTNFNPLPWAELPPTRSGCPGPTQPGLEHLLGLFQFVLSYEPQTNQTSRTPKPITASQTPNRLPHFCKEVFFLLPASAYSCEPQRKVCVTAGVHILLLQDALSWRHKRGDGRVGGQAEPPMGPLQKKRSEQEENF